MRQPRTRGDVKRPRIREVPATLGIALLPAQIIDRLTIGRRRHRLLTDMRLLSLPAGEGREEGLG
jgi:hypothetical protein